MLCEHIHAALLRMAGCSPSDQGVTFATHCMYPSFEPVRIHVHKTKAGYRIHDGGGATQVAWNHGRDVSTARKVIGRHASMHSLENADGQLTLSVEGDDWLIPGILSVANVSAAAASDIMRAPGERQAALADLIEEVVRRLVGPGRYVREYEAKGMSGKTYNFDFAVQDAAHKWMLLDTVVAHPASVSAKYVAFSDTRSSYRSGLAVYDAPLDQDDASLLKQVADLLPFASLATGLRAEIGHG